MCFLPHLFLESRSWTSRRPGAHITTRSSFSVPYQALFSTLEVVPVITDAVTCSIFSLFSATAGLTFFVILLHRAADGAYPFSSRTRLGISSLSVIRQVFNFCWLHKPWNFILQQLLLLPISCLLRPRFSKSLTLGTTFMPDVVSSECSLTNAIL